MMAVQSHLNSPHQVFNLLIQTTGSVGNRAALFVLFHQRSSLYIVTVCCFIGILSQ
jgi:hypothetical protein